MCTVIVEVAKDQAQGTRVLAVRDEHPGRAWDAPGRWWPEAHPEVLGVRDRKAGGAWLAADGSRLSVILNRAEQVADMVPPSQLPLGSRGAIVLDSIAGEALPAKPHTESFNLVEVSADKAQITYWNGVELQTVTLAPGVHMIAHGEVDDPQYARIAEWLPKFSELAGAPAADWRRLWIDTLTQSSQLSADDDRAIIRDNTPHGFATQSLLVCLAEVGGAAACMADTDGEAGEVQGAVRLESAVLQEAASWHNEEFVDHTAELRQR